MKRAIVVGLLGLLGLPAHAEPPQLVVSVPLFALSSRAIALEGELPVADQLSAGLVLGVRDPAGGDFGGHALAAGAALRGWWRRDQRGVHAVARLEGNLVHLRRSGMDLGTAYGVVPSVGIGYRFVIRDHLVITADLGVGLDLDVGPGRVPTHRRWTPVYGLALGGSW